MRSDDKGPDARRGRFRSPARAAFEGPSPPAKLWRFPRVDLIDMVLGWIRRYMRKDWPGMHVRLLLAQPWEGWFPELGGSTRVLKWTSDSGLFVDRSGGFFASYPQRRGY